MGLIHQALLGYENGHRLLASSRDLAPRAQAALIALSDTEVGHERVLTGVPLPDSDLYALCSTWPAPTVSRPGAVWAHALLVPFDELASVDVEQLAATLDGPPTDLVAAAAQSAYRGRRRLFNAHHGSDSPASRSGPDPASDHVARCLQAAYASRSRVAYVPGSGRAAEAAVLRLWAVQWPDLKGQFSFRTRVAGREEAPRDVDLLVIVGTDRTSGRHSADRPWLAQLAREIEHDASGPLSEWLRAFGPHEPPRPASVRALARLWIAVNEGDAVVTASRLAARYPKPSAGRELKAATFGQDTHWWPVPEIDRIRTIVASDEDVWDIGNLELTTRLVRVLKGQPGAAVIRALNPHASQPVKHAVVDAVREAGEPEPVAMLAELDTALASAALSSHLARSAELWRLLDHSSAARLLEDHDRGSDIEVVRAALVAGHFGAVELAASASALGPAVNAMTDAEVQELATANDSKELAAHAQSRDILRFAHANAPLDGAAIREALGAERLHADDLWLRVAAKALVEDGESLPIVFGPLHLAITEDRMPRELWKTLGRVAPPAPDPAQRLRRLLVQRVRQEGWSKSQVKAALNGAGPHAGEVLQDLDDEDPLIKIFKGIVKRITQG